MWLGRGDVGWGLGHRKEEVCSPAICQGDPSAPPGPVSLFKYLVHSVSGCPSDLFTCLALPLAWVHLRAGHHPLFTLAAYYGAGTQ